MAARASEPPAQPGAARERSSARRALGARVPYGALFWFVTIVAVWTTSGRTTFPDDEIYFRTARSLVETGDLAIEPIEFRTGELPGRPDRTFGVAGRARSPSPDEPVYSIFGLGLSVLAAPSYALARATWGRAPEVWARAPRSDLLSFWRASDERQALRERWLRLVTSLTNCLALGGFAVATARWLEALELGPRASLLAALGACLGTVAWSYAGTLLSEPLSALLITATAAAIARWHRDGAPGALALAGLGCGAVVHGHILNVLAVPILIGWAVCDRARLRSSPRWARWAAAAGVALGAGSLLVSQALRFGDPLETGRRDDYGRWVAPLEGALGQLFGLSHGLTWFAPALVLGLGTLVWQTVRGHGGARWTAAQRRALVMVAALVGLRWAVVAARSDWFGGWTWGPRYLAPGFGLLALPLGLALDRAEGRLARRRWGLALGACALPMAWLAVHSNFEWMAELARAHGRPGYVATTFWSLERSPWLGTLALERRALAQARGGGWLGVLTWARIDAIGFGALRLAARGHPSLLAALGALAVGAGVAARRLARALR